MTDNALIRIRRILEWLAASLLAVTGILKIASAFGSDRIMTLAWQLGRGAAPKLKTAAPVERRFQLLPP